MGSACTRRCSAASSRCSTRALLFGRTSSDLKLEGGARSLKGDWPCGLVGSTDRTNARRRSTNAARPRRIFRRSANSDRLFRAAWGRRVRDAARPHPRAARQERCFSGGPPPILSWKGGLDRSRGTGLAGWSGLRIVPTLVGGAQMPRGLDGFSEEAQIQIAYFELHGVGVYATLLGRILALLDKSAAFRADLLRS